MNMLVEIAFEILECFVKSLIADACVRRNFVVRCYDAQLTENLPNRIMFPQHHAYWIVNSSKRSERSGLVVIRRPCHRQDVREEYLLFFEHVWLQIRAKSSKELAHINEFSMIFSVRVNYFVDKRFKPVHF